MTPYPFSAVVGLDDLRLALLLNAVSPAVGGVLVRGEKGTAKSTVVRALASLLPPVVVVAGCRFSCDPAAPDPGCPDGPHEPGVAADARPARLVELPVGASEDRLVGALDLERALTEGVKAYEPGLLAAAHRGVLYVDEVNLLHDHLVDLLLDAAAMGRAHVERDGVSVAHASRFLLVGTMNPEEGELRPQLLDRFGLTVEVKASRQPSERAEVVRRRLAYEADPAGFAARWAGDDAELATRIAAARARLGRVVLTDAALRQVAHVCAAFEVDGMRADLVTARTAIALAAWHGRDEVLAEDVRTAAMLALPHRRRRNPFDAPGLDEQALDDALDQAAEGPDEDPPPSGGGGPEDHDGDSDATSNASHPPRAPDTAATPRTEGETASAAPEAGQDTEDGPATGPEAGPGSPTPRGESEAAGGQHPVAGPGTEQVASAGEPYRTRLFTVPGLGDGAAGRRSRAETGHGRTTRSERARGPLGAVHLTATLLAAAPHQRARGRSGPGLVLRADDLRRAIREGREGNLVLFAVDASGSMAARQRMSAVKGAVLSLLLDAYQRRDKVGLVTFRGQGGELALPPTSSVEAAAARLRTLPTGGRTPLAEGLLRAAETLRIEAIRDPRRRPLLVVVTDGRATGGARPLERASAAARLFGGVASVVVDCESGPVRLGLAGRLAADLGGDCVRLGELSADGLSGLVREARGAA
ncbi:MAG: magnesium chelatase subunit [Actinomycetota bacterium]|jgi:magnesium chelatase subunit D|nr:magnesium chelatase subunit [Actinomycetota bacterium]